MATLKPTEDRVLFRKCIRDHIRDEKGNVLVHLCDGSQEITNWVQILAVGPKCKLFTQDTVGKYAYCRKNIGHDLFHVPGTEADFIVREHAENDAMACLDPAIYTHE